MRIASDDAVSAEPNDRFWPEADVNRRPHTAQLGPAYTAGRLCVVPINVKGSRRRVPAG